MTPRPRHALIASLLVLAACGNPTGTKATPTPTPSTAAWTPAPILIAPSGERGADWHNANRDQPWARHVLAVDTIGRLLIVSTDLTATDLDTAVQVCRAGHAYVQSVGAPDAPVVVRGAGNSTLAKSDGGTPCRVAL